MYKLTLPGLFCCLASLSASPLASATGSDAAPDLPALIQCEQGIAQFQQLVGPVHEPLRAVALGWTPLPRSNPFMAEYRLNTPLQLQGASTDLIAISGGTVLAVLDAARHPPQALADALALEVVLDEDGKFMAGREVTSRDLHDAQSGQMLIESAVLGVSTVNSHPGKVLLGCTYSLDLPEEEQAAAEAGQTASVPAPAATAPSATADHQSIAH